MIKEDHVQSLLLDPDHLPDHIHDLDPSLTVGVLDHHPILGTIDPEAADVQEGLNQEADLNRVERESPERGARASIQKTGLIPGIQRLLTRKKLKQMLMLLIKRMLKENI